MSIQVNSVTFKEPSPYELNNVLGMSTVEYNTLPQDEKPRVADVVFEYYLNGHRLTGSVREYSSELVLDSNIVKLIKEKLSI